MSLIFVIEGESVTDIYQCKEFRLQDGVVLTDQIQYKLTQQHLIPIWVKVLKPYYETHLPLVKYLHIPHIDAGYIEISSQYNIRLDISRDLPFLKFMINYQEAQASVLEK
ncbi:MAG: hypothetical protein IPO92_18980 [Saprospiraceae bacterium]|nr:hypothetical protein [Saprospiraceae bacterium]